jgi:hypothetical protein
VQGLGANRAGLFNGAESAISKLQNCNKNSESLKSYMHEYQEQNKNSRTRSKPPVKFTLQLRINRMKAHMQRSSFLGVGFVGGGREDVAYVYTLHIIPNRQISSCN